MSRPTDHEETIEHLRDIAGAIRDGSRSPITTPLPALEYIPPQILSPDDRKLLHGLALRLVDRADDLLLGSSGRTPEGLSAAAAATTAATTALIACREDIDSDGEEHRRESIRRARIEGAEKAIEFTASGTIADPIAAARAWADRAAKDGAL